MYYQLSESGSYKKRDLVRKCDIASFDNVSDSLENLYQLHYKETNPFVITEIIFVK